MSLVVDIRFHHDQKMPKKFIIENPKSTAARQRKKQIDDEKKKKKDVEQEDSLWLEGNSKITKRQQKKEAEVKKKQEHFQKRLEVKALLENELVELTGKSLKTDDGIDWKLTRAQICKHTEKKPKKKDLNINLEENVNSININENVAKTVEEAISILESNQKQEDKHPEKRMKAAYNAFEDQKLKELKSKKPTLRLSQMKQLIFKEWQKSPENPMNIQ